MEPSCQKWSRDELSRILQSAANKDDFHKFEKYVKDKGSIMNTLVDLLNNDPPSMFKFGEILKTKYCVSCDTFEKPTRVPNRTSSYLFCDVTEEICSVQQCFNDCLHRNREILECKCHRDLRARNQYETIRFSSYPNFLTLFPTYKNPTSKLTPDDEIITPDAEKYKLVAVVAESPTQYCCALKINGIFYACDDHQQHKSLNLTIPITALLYQRNTITI